MLTKDQINKYHAALKEMAVKYNVVDLAAKVLDDPQFIIAPASENFHHAYDGGLVQHTYEVLTLCLTNNQALDYKIDEKLIFLAALYHDLGKTQDYEKVKDPFGEKWVSAEHRYSIHHIPRSTMVFYKESQCLRNKFTSTIEGYHSYRALSVEEEDEVIHAILSHHQLKEWGSPVQPRTGLAWLLHLCDNMSARLADNGIHKFKG